MRTRLEPAELADVLVWDLVSTRCALARPVRDEVRIKLRENERAVVGALLDMGILKQRAIAPMPPVSPTAAPTMF